MYNVFSNHRIDFSSRDGETQMVNMINGGSEEFLENGWHGMYVLSAKEINDRIYPLTMDFEIFKNHARQAAEQWQNRRQWFDRNWIALN